MKPHTVLLASNTMSPLCYLPVSTGPITTETFEHKDSEKVSIIIPQFGKAHLTWQCLDSLAGYIIPYHDVEVIVVDDCSPDSSADQIKSFSRFSIRVVKNLRNWGFAKSCNHGAALANGQVLVFLNNDTLSFEDWLQPMLMALNSDQRRSIIGAQLIYPDGRIQHSGVWFFQSSEGPLTALERSDELPLSHLGPQQQSQVVPAVTGACLMMRRHEFLELGGFDEQYVNDLEDTDLCLKVNQRGQVCWYEANAKLIHLHSATRGMNPERNRRMAGVFYKKWCGNDYIKLTLPLSPQPWRRLSQDFVIVGQNNRWAVWQIVQTILGVWQEGDRIVLLDQRSHDGTRELMENMARHNPERVVFFTAEPDQDISVEIQDRLSTFQLHPLQAVWLHRGEIAPYHWEIMLKELGKRDAKGRIVFGPYSPKASPLIIDRLTQWTYRPLMSIVMPVYNPELETLQKAIESVQCQQYPFWELCICDDESDNPDVIDRLMRYAESDARIKIRRLAHNEGIAAASNAAIAMATGEYVGLLDQDDELTPDALWWVGEALQHQQWDVLYSDDDKIEPDGRLVDPFFKPDWSPETLLSYNFVSHFGVYRKELGDRIGWFRSGVDGSQDYDLILRMSELTNRIYHIPRVLYHWRKSATSVAGNPSAKDWAYSAAVKALNDAVNRRGWKGRIVKTPLHSMYRRLFTGKQTPRTSIVVTVRSGPVQVKRFLTSIRRFSTPGTYDVIFVLDPVVAPETREYLQSTDHVTIDMEQGHRWTDAYSEAVERFKNDLVVFLHDDSEVASVGWLDEMALWALTPSVGPMGCRILDSHGLVEEAGLYLDPETIVKPFYAGFNRDQIGYFGALQVVRNVAAVSDTCLMTRRDLFVELGGFSGDLAGIHAVDFCLSAHKQGYRTVVTPWAEVYHHSHNDSIHWYETDRVEVVSRMRDKWASVLKHDGYFYPSAALSTIIEPEPLTPVGTVDK